MRLESFQIEINGFIMDKKATVLMGDVEGALILAKQLYETDIDPLGYNLAVIGPVSGRHILIDFNIE